MKRLGLRRFFFLLILLFCYSDFLLAQERSDFAAWFNADLDIAWNSKWQSILSGELRTKDYVGDVDLYSLGLFTNYVQSKAFKVGVGYEFFLNNIGSSKLKGEHRMMIQSNLQHSIGRLKFAWRISFMDTFYSFSDPNFRMRNRIKLDYSIPKSHLQPFISTELYHTLYHGVSHQKNRYNIGVNYTMKPNQQFDLFYMMEDYSTKSFTRHVIGFGYCYFLPWK